MSIMTEITTTMLEAFELAEVKDTPVNRITYLEGFRDGMLDTAAEVEDCKPPTHFLELDAEINRLKLL